MRTQPPVEVPVHVHPGRPAPGRVGAPLRVERRLRGSHAWHRVGQPELALVQEVLVDQTLRLARVEVVEDQREERREREGLRGLLVPAGEIPERSRLVIPALGFERGSDPIRARVELVRLAR